jgi:glutathione S-transferase
MTRTSERPDFEITNQSGWTNRNLGTEGFVKATVDESMERLRQTAERIDTVVAKGSPWLAGEAISIADFCVLPAVVRMTDLHLEHV